MESTQSLDRSRSMKFPFLITIIISIKFSTDAFFNKNWILKEYERIEDKYLWDSGVEKKKISKNRRTRFVTMEINQGST